LVLSRFPSERILIGSGDSLITVTIVHVAGQKVRVGIDAPKDVPINREEVFEAIERDRLRQEQQQRAVEDGGQAS
jgi:carbon storage regulator